MVINLNIYSNKVFTEKMTTIEVICKYARSCSSLYCNHRIIHDGVVSEGSCATTNPCFDNSRPQGCGDIFCIPIIKIKRQQHVRYIRK